MYGMFVGFLMTWACVVLIGRGRASMMPKVWMLAAFVAFIAVMGFDGVNATVYDLNHLGLMIPYLYEPRNDLRALTGFLSGMGMAGLALPVMNFMLWRPPAQEPLIERPRDFAAIILIQLVWMTMEMSGSALFLYPLSLLAVFGVLATLNCLNSVFVLSFFPRLRAENWRGTLNAFAVAMVVTGLELGALSALRYAVLGWQTLP